MNNTTHTFKLTTLAAALTALCAPAHALDDAEMAALTKPESSVSVGIGNWSKERPQQGIYDGMRDDDAYGLVDLDIVKRNDATGTWLTFSGRNLGLDTRELKAEYLRQGDIGASFEYSRTPRENPWTYNTGLLGIGSTNLTISGAGAAALPKSDMTLGTRRDLAQLGFYKNLMPGLDVNISFKNETKEGTRHWGLGSQPFFMVEPIDSTTRQLDVTLNYAGERFQMSGGYLGSSYDNANSLAWGLINGAAQPGTASAPNPTPLTLPLDNKAHQLFLDGGYSFTPTTRGTFKLSYARATQDESLPTYDLAAPNNRFVGAPSNIDGRIDTKIVQLGLTSRPLPKLSVVASLRYQDVDDKTPLVGLVGNNTTGAISVHNTPHSYKTKSGKLEATYKLPQGFSVIGGVDVSRQDRSAPQFEAERYVPFRTSVDEETYRLQLRRSLSDTVNGAVTYLHSKRDGSSYLATNDAETADQINPLHIADRERDKWRLSADWTPMDRLSLQFLIEDARDDYSKGRPYGLQDGSAKLYSVDANFAVNDNWKLSAWYSHDETKARQFNGRWSRGTLEHEADRDAHLRDEGDSFGFGVRGAAGAKLKLGADLQVTRNRSEYKDSVALTGSCGANGFCTVYPTSGGVTGAPLPDIENKLNKLNLFAEYALQKNSEVRFDFIHERWETDDWTWQFANGTPFSYGTTTDGTTVSAARKQTSNFVGARYIVRFQ